MEALVRELRRAGTGGCCAPTQAEKVSGDKAVDISARPRGWIWGEAPRSGFPSG